MPPILKLIFSILNNSNNQILGHYNIKLLTQYITIQSKINNDRNVYEPTLQSPKVNKNFQWFNSEIFINTHNLPCYEGLKRRI